jgi:hypothetical protein
MAHKPPLKLDARAAWQAWTTSGSPEDGAEFLDRIGSWTDGTAAQLTRCAAGQLRYRPTRAEVADRLRQELAVVAGGEPVSYLVALDLARRNVIAGLRSHAAR